MDRLTMDDGIWVNFAREVIEKCDPLTGREVTKTSIDQ